MNTVQPHVQAIRHQSTVSSSAVLNAVEMQRLKPINDERNHDFQYKNTWKKLFAIIVMLGMSAYLVWTMG